MSTVGVAFERAEVNGVPVFWADAPPPFTAALAFRVGRADESLPSAGLTHLVEHLALFPVGRTAFASNGTVDDLWTIFYATGTPAEALGFLTEVAANLSALPLERIATEKRVLLTEESGRGASAYLRLLNLRYGARTFGLASYQEFGLRTLEADDVARWAAEYFVRENAAVWITGEPPAGFELPLPSGRRATPPVPSFLSGLELPAQFVSGTGGVSIGMVGERSTALSTAFGIAMRRAHARLRLESGLSYDAGGTYQPLTPSLAHMTLGADCLDEHAPTVRDQLLEVLRGLAEFGPSEDELQEVRSERARAIDDPTETRGWLDYAARELLLSGEAPSPDELQVELEALSAGEAASALAGALPTAIVLAPARTPKLEGFVDWGSWHAEPVRGRTFRQRPLRAGRNVKVVASEEGVTLHVPKQDEPVTVRFADCCGVLRWSARRATLLGIDGSWIELRARTLRNGDELLRHVLAHVPAGSVIPMHDMQDPEALLELASEKLGRAHVWKEFEMLPEHLLPGERVENMAQLDEFMKRGLLVLTDRRLLYVSRGYPARGKQFREIALAEIVAVEGSEPQARFRGRVTIRTSAGTRSFARFAKRVRAGEFWQALEDRATASRQAG